MRDSTIIHPGKQVGHLLIIASMGSRNRTGLWECECACGRHVTKRTDVLLAAIKRGSATGCGRGCGMRKTTAHRDPIPEPGNDPGNNPDIDWDTFINDYHELIDRYRGDSSSEDAA